MRCPHCGRETPEGHFCAYCGAHLPEANSQHSATTRTHVYAANPHEHVYQPAIISTFFPHLNPRRTQQFRWILFVLAVIVVLLVAARYIPVAIVAAAMIVPLLYLIYFYVVEVYEDSPFSVLGATFVAGAVLGILFNLAMYRLVLSQERFTLAGLVPTTGYILLADIVAPIIGLVLMVAGPLLLYFRRRSFDEVLDGLVFGVASGLGYAAAQSMILSWLQVTGATQPPGNTISWVLPIIRIALFVPLLHASTAGLVCAVLWLQRDPTAPRRALGPLASVPVAIVIALLGEVVPALVVTYVGSQLLNLVWYGLAVIILMLIVRHVLHVGLIEKARELGHGGTLRCPHCLHTVPDVPFCPNCGIAMRSIARRQRQASAPMGGASEQSAPTQ